MIRTLGSDSGPWPTSFESAAWAPGDMMYDTAYFVEVDSDGADVRARCNN